MSGEDIILLSLAGTLYAFLAVMWAAAWDSQRVLAAFYDESPKQAAWMVLLSPVWPLALMALAVTSLPRAARAIGQFGAEVGGIFRSAVKEVTRER